MPRVKGDLRPRGRVAPYAIFLKTSREEQKRLHPNESVVFADFSRTSARRWNALNEDEKKPYQEMSERDKLRFDEEMQALPVETVQGGGGGRKKKKRTKDPNAPKRPLSQFIWFSYDERPKVKGQNPEYGLVDVAKELGKLWGQAGPDVKKKYEILYDRDKARYEREMNLYKARGVAPLPQDDDDDEESVDD